ncbi:MAG TPA: sulfatase-like hydrolase/transferase [Gemmataceae bacterium]|nr:sulfatase-like hydrolase/transferase [Gemmataceae bacterium]
MFLRSKAGLIAALAIGALGGWLAASGRLDPSQWVGAAAPDAPKAAVQPAAPSCCSSDGGRLIALAGPAAKNSADDPKKPAADRKTPNILVIMGDDIGQSNISAYTRGLMGYQTPNIDRIAKEGMLFTDYYAEQSCTAGRSSFITGQCTLRTGLSKVGIPAAPVGLQKEDPTIAELLKNHWFLDHDFVAQGAAAGAAKFLETLKDYPPRQRAASFTIDQAMEKLKQRRGGLRGPPGPAEAGTPTAGVPASAG